MSSTQNTVEPVRFDFTSEETFLIRIPDHDLSENPIPHAGDTLRLTFRDADDNLVLDCGTAPLSYITVEANDTDGALSVIVIRIPYPVWKAIPEGTYYGTLVRIIGANDREVILPMIVTQRVGPTRPVA